MCVLHRVQSPDSLIELALIASPCSSVRCRVHKAQKDGAVFKMLKPGVLGGGGPQLQEPKRKLTRAQQIARKAERHDAIRAEIDAAQLAPEEKPIAFDD